MAAFKPEVLLSQRRDELARKFQRLYPYFRRCPTQLYYMQCHRKLLLTENPRCRPCISSLAAAILHLQMKTTSGFVASRKVGHPRKHRYRTWNFVSTSFLRWDKSISGLAAAILDLQLTTTSGDVTCSTVKSGTPENMGIAVGFRQ